MKKIATLLLAVLMLSTFCFSAGALASAAPDVDVLAAAPLADAKKVLSFAVLYMPFDDNFDNAKGSAVVTSVGEPAAIEGVHGGAVQLGSGNYLATDIEFGADSYTITGWVRIDYHNPGDDPVLFGNKDWSAGGNPGFILCVQGDSYKFNIRTGKGGRWDLETGFDKLPNDVSEWSYLTLVVDRETSSYTLYINGEVVDTDSMAEKVLSGESADVKGLTFNIGEGGTGSYNGSGLTSCFDDFAVFKKALTADEINALYLYDYAPDPQDLLDTAILYLPMNGSFADANGKTVVTPVGEPATIEGVHGGAAQLGSGNYLATDIEFGANSYTITGWTRIDYHNPGDDPVLFGNKDWSAGGNPGFILCVQGDSYKFNIRTGKGGRWDLETGFDKLPNDVSEWSYLTLVVDRETSSYTLYINGEVVDTDSMAEKVLSGESADVKGLTFNIGEGGTGCYNGSGLTSCFDDFAVFDKALTADEIKMLYTYDYPVTAKQVLSDASLYLNFDNNIKDAAGNCTTEMKGEPAYIEGMFGSGIQTPAGSYIKTQGLKFGADSYTVTSWVRLDAHSSDPVLFGNKSWDSGSLTGFLLSARDGDYKYNMNVKNGDRFDVESSYASLGADVSGWHYLTAVVDRAAQTYTLYVNGVAIQTASFAENNFADGAPETVLPFNIGEDGTGAYNAGMTFKASFDEFAVFNRALSAEEIAVLYAYEPDVVVLPEEPEEPEEPETEAPETEAPATEPEETQAPETEEPKQDDPSPITADLGLTAAVVTLVSLCAVVVVRKRK